MEELQLRKTVGGYKRDDVKAYIEALVKKYEDLLTEAREEQEAAKAELEAACAENAKLFEKVRMLEEDRDSVSRAVISAQREAENILAEAREKGDAIVASAEAEAKEVSEKADRIRGDIRSMRVGAAAALRNYEAALGAMLSDDGIDEE
ncbi:MAG: DivIVA domain-containing protein [Clostridia bacterium]|nr:DivIVA domain-containing protein [Clostridia bacterium]